jgi:acetyl esterase
MGLGAEEAIVLEAIASLGVPDVSETTPEVARKFSELRRQSLPPGPEAEVRTLSMPGPGGEIALRVYRPLAAPGTLPVLVWFHGGGFVLGDLEQADPDCRMLSTDASCVVVSVDYRLAPEHPFPAAPEDCFAATRWVFEHARELGADGGRLAVGGDSAGGNLATVSALLARERGGPQIRLQVLVYPVTDLTSFDTPSYLAYAENHFLTRRAMIWFRDHYVGGEQGARDPLASPLHHPDLSGLPAAHIVTGECDPLRDEGEAYAKRLERAGTRVTLSRHAGTIHGFFTMSAFLAAGRRAHAEVAGALRSSLQAEG